MFFFLTMVLIKTEQVRYSGFLIVWPFTCIKCILSKMKDNSGHSLNVSYKKFKGEIEDCYWQMDLVTCKALKSGQLEFWVSLHCNYTSYFEN